MTTSLRRHSHLLVGYTGVSAMACSLSRYCCWVVSLVMLSWLLSFPGQMVLPGRLSPWNIIFLKNEHGGNSIPEACIMVNIVLFHLRPTGAPGGTEQYNVGMHGLETSHSDTFSSSISREGTLGSAGIYHKSPRVVNGSFPQACGGLLSPWLVTLRSLRGEPLSHLHVTEPASYKSGWSAQGRSPSSPKVLSPAHTKQV